MSKAGKFGAWSEREAAWKRLRRERVAQWRLDEKARRKARWEAEALTRYLASRTQEDVELDRQWEGAMARDEDVGNSNTPP